MDVFKLLDSNDVYELTVDNFETATHKDKKYYITRGKDKTIQYALCPICGNTIRIINLYHDNHEEEKTKRRATHGRHYIGKKIPHFPAFDQKAYLDCPYANPQAYKLIRRESKEKNKDLVNLLEKNEELIIKQLNKITGINFSKKARAKLFCEFFESKAYEYQFVHNFNIPYAIFFTSKAINLYGQYVRVNSEPGKRILEFINNQCENFYVDSNNRITKKEKTPYSQLLLWVKSQHISKNNTQYLIANVEEKIGDKFGETLSYSIEIRPCILENP